MTVIKQICEHLRCDQCNATYLGAIDRPGLRVWACIPGSVTAGGSGSIFALRRVLWAGW